MKKRLDYFDIAKGIGVILVLLGHLQGQDIFCFSPYILPMCEWIFSFHMALFFIIAGMLISYKGDIKKDIKVLAKRRFKGIMVPYYWFSFFYMTVVIVAFIKKQILINTVALNLWYVLSCFGMSVLWFLPALFFGELLFIYIMQKCSGKEKKAIAIIAGQCIVALVCAYLLYRGQQDKIYNTTIKEGAHQFAQMALRPFIVCAYVAIGYYGYKLIDRVFGESEKINIKELLTGIALMIVGASFVWVNHGVDFRSLVFKNVAAYLLCSCTSSFGLILICKNMKPFRLLKFFGVNSLIFMAVHGSETVTYQMTRLAMWANQYLTRARGYICYAIIVTGILIYVSIMILLINRFVPFIAGKPFVNPFSKKTENT